MALPRPLRNVMVAPGTRPGAPVARICRQFAKVATEAAQLDEATGSVHQLRLIAKALRALLRLADHGRPHADLLGLDHTVRTHAGHLARAREHAVQSALLERVCRDQPRTVREFARRWLAARKSALPPDSTRRQIGRRLAVACLRAARLLRARITPASIVASLERSLRKSCRQCRNAADTGEPEVFHSWRRWQKRLESQLRLVLPAPSARQRRRLESLHELQEELGRLHDLDELDGLLAAGPTPPATDQRALRQLRRELQRRAARLRIRVLKGARQTLFKDATQLVRKARKAWQS